MEIFTKLQIFQILISKIPFHEYYGKNKSLVTKHYRQILSDKICLDKFCLDNI